MYSFDVKKRVRYGETDQMGFVYYGNYAQYYEIGRVEMLRALGMTYKYMEEDLGIMMPVISMQVRYLRPAKYDQLITIRTTLRELPNTKITFYMELFNEAGKLLNSGQVVLKFLDPKLGKTVPVPSELLNKLQPYFETI